MQHTTTDFTSITELLLSDHSLSLVLLGGHFSYGVRHIRSACIVEPNPNKGAVVGDGDQAYLQGDTRTRRGLDFDARDIGEGLDLLERAVEGKPTFGNTATSDGLDGPVHGYEEAQGGLDSWMHQTYRLRVFTMDGQLTARAYCSPFPTRVTICERPVESVADAIRPFEEHAVSEQTLRGMLDGGSVMHEIRKRFSLPSSDTLMEMNAVQALSPQAIGQYQQALLELAPFNVTPKAKNALLVSLVMGTLYDTKTSDE